MDFEKYDDQNVFAKILRGEIPNDTVYEDDNVMAFKDINPRAPIHILVVPKKPYISMTDFTEKAPASEMTALMHAVSKIIKEYNLNEHGYRVIANAGLHGGQEVPHLHLHILGGQKLPPMLA